MIAAGDVVAVRRRGPLAEIIRHVTGQSWSHVAVAISPTRAIEAREFVGVREIDLAALAPCDVIATGKGLPPAADAMLRGMIGRRYSYLDAVLAGFGLGPLFGGCICSEVAARAVAMIYGRRCDARTPGDVVAWLLDAGATLAEAA